MSAGKDDDKPVAVLRGGSAEAREAMRRKLRNAGFFVLASEAEAAADSGESALPPGPLVTPEGGYARFFADWPSLQRQMRQWIKGGVAGRTGVCFLLLNLDHFKRARAFLGAEAAIALLREVAVRLAEVSEEQAREIGGGEDSEPILIGHMGADEFAIAVGGMNDRVEASRFAKALLMAVSRPYDGIAQQVYLTGRIGITFAPEDGLSTKDLLRNAASIIHHEERSGRNSYRFYAQGMTDTAARRFELEATLSHAVNVGELEVYYQPQACIRTGRIVGAEALVRWRHQGTVLPAELFIATAEDVGLITEIGNRVLLSACREAKSLHDHGLGPFEISINISAYQFRRLDMAEVVANALEESGLDPACLVLEVTESLVLADVDRTVETFAALRRMGVHLALDDFGTGYSSLSYLKSLTIDRLKLDRSFVEGLPADPGDRAVTEAIIRMAQALRLDVTAEGVEDERQLHYLREIGCDHYQGFLLAKPLSLEQFERFLDDYSLIAQAKS